jgi:hypothetical protein
LAAPANASKVLTAELLLADAIQKPVERQTRTDQMQVASILRDLGYRKKRQRAGERLIWAFVPTSA